MKNIVRLATLIAIVAMAVALVGPLSTAEAQGEGGIVVDATFGSGPNTLSAVFCRDTACRRPVNFLFPTLGAVDPKTLLTTPGAPGGLMKKWTASDDGKVYTFEVRNDWKWPDGSIISAKDVELYYKLVINPDTKSPNGSAYTSTIDKVEAKDDKTLVVTFKESSCRALDNAGGLYAIPSSFYSKADAATLKDNAVNLKPDLTAGPFKFGEFRASERVSLLADKNFPDALDKAVKPEGFIQKVVPNQNVLIEQLFAGEINFQDNMPSARVDDALKLAKEGKLQVYEWPGNTWDYLALNYADPNKPEGGLGADGKPAKQSVHPILGDKSVRMALALALDIDEMIKGAVFGKGTRMASSVLPSSWAYNKDLKALPYDPEKAKKMLDDAGWKVGSDGIRAKDGKPMKLTVYTNQGNTRREAILAVVKDKWTAVGVDVTAEAIDFNKLVELSNAQTFDAFIIGWRNGFPDDPDQTELFTSKGDIPKSGANNTSYYNPEVDKLMAEALTLKGCDPKARAAIYGKIQEILAQDLPYIFLFSQNGYYVASSKIKGFAPIAGNAVWNVDTWTVAK